MKDAENLRDASLAGDAARNRIVRWRRDLEMVRRLEELQLEKTSLWADEFELVSPPPVYGPAFADFGIDVQTADLSTPAEQIRQSPIKNDLLAAVDDWASRETGESRRRLLAIARLVDGDPWRNRLRDAIERDDNAGAYGDIEGKGVPYTIAGHDYYDR